MFRRYVTLSVLVLLIISWYFLPKVTEKDAIAYAYVIFGEYCHTYHIDPSHFDNPPQRSVEGGNRTLIFVYRFISNKEADLIVKIDKQGHTQVFRETSKGFQYLENAPSKP